jgi:inorganic pyrophosphatase
VACDSRNHHTVRTLKELNNNFVKELEHFFVSYNEMRGKKFKLLGCYGPKRAQGLLHKGVKVFKTVSNGGKTG